MADETEAERVHRLAARALRAWLVEHEPAGTAGAIVPLSWLRDELYALRESYPGDRRVARARGYSEALTDVLRLLRVAEQRQRIDVDEPAQIREHPAGRSPDTPTTEETDRAH